MSNRTIALTLAAAAWLFAAGGDGAGLSAQERGTAGTRGTAAAARARSAAGQAPEEADLFEISAERALAFARAQQDGLNWVPGEVLVKFKPGVSLAQGTRALSRFGAP